jgi:hypothetical protein
MKKSLLFYIPLLVFIMATSSFAQHYSKDFLETGNPGGWSTSLKTWDEEWTLNAGEEIYLDIWFNIDCSLITGGLWIVFDPAEVSLLDVQVYDGNELPGPWDSGFTTELLDPDGPGTYMVAVGNISTVQPDQDGDFILSRIHLRYEGREDTHITIGPIPAFTTFACAGGGIPLLIFSNTVTIYQRECTTDGDCNDGLWCTEHDLCNNGICQHTNRDCSGTADQCNDGVCNENVNSCVKQQKPDGIPCDDGFFCNGEDTCSDGSCSIHTGDPCTSCSSYGCSCDEFRNFCIGCSGDSECDGICSPGETGPLCSGSDNCTYTPNGPVLGSCTTGVSTLFDRDVCTAHSECGTGGYCSMAQEDSYPPQTNGVGDACDCEGDFDCDGDCDGTDAAKFKTDFGRSGFNMPCITSDPCNGDFECDADVDGTDAALFKSDFGRSSFLDPCPACEVGNWCVYQ